MHATAAMASAHLASALAERFSPGLIASLTLEVQC